MNEDQIKIVPAKKEIAQIQKATFPKGVFLFVLVFVSFLSLLLLISYLPITMMMRFASLAIGSFLIIDLHRTLKTRYYDTGSF